MLFKKGFAGLLWSLPAALLLMAPAKPAFAQTVDCNDPTQSIQSRLDAGDTLINFTGVCDEFVEIRNDKTQIIGVSGDRARDVISFGIEAFGVQQVFLGDFTTNGELSILDGAAVSLFNVTLTGGANVATGSQADFFGSTVTGSGNFAIVANADFFMGSSTIDDLRGSIFITNGANAQFRNTDITNTDFGVFVGRNGSLRFRNGRMGPALIDDGNVGCNPLCANEEASIRLDSVVIEGANNDPITGGAIALSRNVALILRGDSVVTNNGSQPAIGVFNDSSFRQDAPGGGGAQINGDVQVFGNSYADLRAAVITGNVEVDLKSIFRIGAADFGGDPENTALTGDSTISRDSAFVVEEPRVTINGQITCLDRKSSFSGGFVGVVKFNNCTDFDGKKLDDDDD